jgi:hypothetical protein
VMCRSPGTAECDPSILLSALGRPAASAAPACAGHLLAVPPAAARSRGLGRSGKQWALEGSLGYLGIDGCGGKHTLIYRLACARQALET